jgi:hypothetical protein
MGRIGAGALIALAVFASVALPPVAGIEMWKYVLAAVSLWLFVLAGRSPR